MTYVANDKRYDTMTYNRCGRSGMKLPAVSLGLWHNFGGVDVFENGQEVIVVVALPGVAPERVEVHYSSGELLVRADCPIPFASTRRSVRRLEIPYGRFERRIHLAAVNPETVHREFRDGYLIMQFNKTAED